MGASRYDGTRSIHTIALLNSGVTQCQIPSPDVTEGSGGVWERLHYDWSNPDRVILATTDSNVWGGASGHTYTFVRRPDGKTDIDVIVVRDGKNLKGWILGLVLGTVGKRVLTKAFENSITAIETRHQDLKRRASIAA